MIKVAINGFGRIGRLVLRAGIKDKEIDFVAVNDLGDIATMAHLFKYDSVHGIYPGRVEVDGKDLVVDGKRIKFLSEKDPIKLPWKQLGVDIVVESTGVFVKRDDIMVHIRAGAKKVLLSAPAKGDEPVQTIVRGVNDDKCAGNDIISNASCTTNSIVPVVMVLEQKFGIEGGFLTTVHSYTNDQKILDLPHKDLRRARAAAVNIIPTSTGAAKSVSDVFPGLKGKMDGIAMRVPTPDASISDLTIVLKKKTTAEEINKEMKKAAETYLKGILEYSEEELVSSDIIGNPHSAIVDGKLTKVVNGNIAKVFSWYDNEWGFSMRMIETIKLMGK